MCKTSTKRNLTIKLVLFLVLVLLCFDCSFVANRTFWKRSFHYTEFMFALCCLCCFWACLWLFLSLFVIVDWLLIGCWLVVGWMLIGCWLFVIVCDCCWLLLIDCLFLGLSDFWTKIGTASQRQKKRKFSRSQQLSLFS